MTDTDTLTRNFHAQLVDTNWLALAAPTGPASFMGYLVTARDMKLDMPYGVVFHNLNRGVRHGLFFPNIDPDTTVKYLKLTQPELFVTARYAVNGPIMGRIRKLDVRWVHMTPDSDGLKCSRELSNCMIISRCTDFKAFEHLMTELNMTNQMVEYNAGMVGLNSEQMKRVSAHESQIIQNFAVWIDDADPLTSPEDIR